MENTSGTGADIQLALTYIGHATVLLECQGVRLLTDPLLRDRVTHLRRRPKALPAVLTGDLDAVLISHLHWDHFDRPSLRLLDKQTPCIAPKGAGALLEQEGFTTITEVEEGDRVKIGHVEITATYAEHGRNGLPFGRQADSLGYLISGRYTTYFPGDTDLFPGMINLGKALDVALLPVWGWGPTLGEGHMDPERAAEALTLLQPRIAVPIHWGTFYPIGLDLLNDKFMRRPPRLFAQRASRRAPNVRTIIVAPGERIELAYWLEEGE